MVKLYSTRCPKCNILEKKLKDKNIDYEEINDLDLMISLGFTQTPMLEVENEIMDFKGANNWINNK
jgi:glutaredoxin-related protein